MKNYRIFILLFFYSLISVSQERKIENIFNDCYFNAMPENGKQIKKLYKSYEMLLISNKLLKDDSGKSYYELFENVLTDKLVDSITNYALLDSMNTLGYSNLIYANKKCTELIKSLQEYQNSNTYILEKRMDSISGNSDPEKAFEVILNTLNYNDFEIDFYKLRALLLLQMNEPMTDIEKPVYTKNRIENSLSVYLTKDNLIMVDQKITSIEELENIIRNYLVSNKKMSLITLHTSRKALYKDYINLVEQVNSTFSKTKDVLSLERFTKKYDKLTKTEKELLDSLYSFEIYEKAPE